MPVPPHDDVAHIAALTEPGRRWSRGWVAAALAIALVVAGLTSSVVLASTSGRATAATPKATTGVSAYWLVASDGGVFTFGGAGFYGSAGDIHLNRPVVGMAGTSDSHGYWLVASDGGIFTYGDAHFDGSTGAIALNRPVVGMTSTADGGGYWLVASDGGVFSFGDAHFYGSMGGRPLNQPIVGIASTPDGRGYWLVAADGGIFSFGDANFYGSTGSLHLNKPIVGMTASPNGGYWLTASDGGVFAFGAPFYGSLGSVPQSRPIVAITSTADGGGYWFTNNNGAVTAYGDADYWGSAPQVINKPVVGMAEADASGQFTGSPYPSGASGYDVSDFQCGGLPPSPHTIGIVQVVGESFGATNSCLQQEAEWAAGGLNLYIFLTYGTAATSGDAACNATASPISCNYGFNAALDAFQKASIPDVNTSVAWWLDVENPPPGFPAWSSTGANASLIEGAIDGLHFRGINSVGIYTSPLTWSGIAGSYQPKAPLWLAWYTGNPQQNCTTGYSYASANGNNLPSGGILITQYASNTYDDDYAC
jgi:hypothetical protein